MSEKIYFSSDTNIYQNRARAVRLTIQLKDLFFGQFGKMFIFEEFGGLRSRDDFSSGKVFGKEKLREGMLKWSKAPIPTSLTVLDEPFRKQAKTVFKDILGYMGDRNFAYPITLAQDLVDQVCITFFFWCLCVSLCIDHWLYNRALLHPKSETRFIARSSNNSAKIPIRSRWPKDGT